jgi:hypothetical protein
MNMDYCEFNIIQLYTYICNELFSGCFKYNYFTPWSTVLLEKLTGSAASQEIPRILWNPKSSLPHSQVLSPCECYLIFFFDGEALLALRPNPKLEDHPLSAVRDCLFNIFAATLHIGGRSSIHNLRTRHAVVTGTHLSRGFQV